MTWGPNEMTCIAIYPRPETGNRELILYPRSFLATNSLGSSFPAPFAGLPGMSAQLYAADACVRVDDGEWWCWEYARRMATATLRVILVVTMSGTMALALPGTM